MDDRRSDSVKNSGKNCILIDQNFRACYGRNFHLANFNLS